MTLKQVTELVAKNTLRYGGRRVTPHPFRDIVAFHPVEDARKRLSPRVEDVVARDLNEVIKTYGSLFNESSGVCDMEAWLEEREARVKSK